MTGSRSKKAWATLAILALAVGTGLAASKPTADQGRELYRIYCQTCHGEQARGDGPTAEVLKVRPPDLTLLRGDDGKFSRVEVTAAIDGREKLLSHGTSEMPIWGLAFQQFDTDVDQSRQAATRIESLVLYLESIQTEP